MGARFTLPPEEVFRHGRLAPIHPGDVLKSEFLEALPMTAYELSKAIGVDQMRISEILRGKRSITADTALRLGKYFGTGGELWLRLQADYDLQVAEVEMAETLAGITPREGASAITHP